MDEQKTMIPYETEEKPHLGKWSGFLNGCAALLVVLIVFAIIACFCFPAIYYYCFYYGDRVKGTVTVSIDGQPARIIEDSAYLACGEEVAASEKTKFHYTDGEMKVATKANAYGSYSYGFTVEELPDTQLRFYSYQFNWWNVTEFMLHYNIDTEANLVEYEAVSVSLQESGRKTEPETYTGSYPLDGEAKEVCVCSP